MTLSVGEGLGNECYVHRISPRARSGHTRRYSAERFGGICVSIKYHPWTQQRCF